MTAAPVEVSDYRKRIFALRARLSPAVDKRITGITSKLRYNEKRYFEDILRRAAGNSLPEPTDIAIGPLIAYERFWAILEPFFETNEAIRGFEKRFLVKLLEDDEASIPDTWTTEFLDRLDETTKEKISRLYLDFDTQIPLSIEDIGKAAYLREETFKSYEKNTLNRWLDDALEKAIEDELKAAGLSDKKPLRLKRTSRPVTNIPVSLVERKNVLDAYVKAIELHNKTNPTVEEIAEIALMPKSTVAKKVAQPSVLTDLSTLIQKKINYANKPERKEFWTEAWREIKDKSQKAAEKILKQRERQRYDDTKEASENGYR
jgi:hypothetical protein